MFEGLVNGLRNADLKAAVYQTETSIVDRTNWILPAIWPRVKQVGNFAYKWASAPVNLVFGCEAKETEPMPKLPEAIDKSALGEGLAKAYKQKCDKAIASAKSTHRLLNLDITGYRTQQAINRHNEAMHYVALPEDKTSTGLLSGVSLGAVGGTLAQLTAQHMGFNTNDPAVSALLKGDVKSAAETALGNLAASNVASASAPAPKAVTQPTLKP